MLKCVTKETVGRRYRRKGYTYKICRNCLFFLELFVFIKKFRSIKALPNKYGHQLAGITVFLPTVPNIPANDIYVRL